MVAVCRYIAGKGMVYCLDHHILIGKGVSIADGTGHCVHMSVSELFDSTQESNKEEKKKMKIEWLN